MSQQLMFSLTQDRRPAPPKSGKAHTGAVWFTTCKKIVEGKWKSRVQFLRSVDSGLELNAGDICTFNRKLKEFLDKKLVHNDMYRGARSTLTAITE